MIVTREEFLMSPPPLTVQIVCDGDPLSDRMFRRAYLLAVPPATRSLHGDQERSSDRAVTEQRREGAR